MFIETKSRVDIRDFFSQHKEKYVKVAAPMVRYSKLHFRTLLRRYGADLTFTPMILADSFCQSSNARLNEFTTSAEDTPLIAQFAARTVDDFVGATKLIYSYVDGVDLNCGCPQKWAIKDGYGCGLLANPQKIFELVKECKNALPHNLSISVKLRILKDSKESVSLCQQIEMCGVTFLTVHGRTASQKSSEDVNTDVLKDIVTSLEIPVIANGGVKTILDADTVHKKTNCAGVMVANGLLSNPALFSGADKTPISCIQDWYNIKKLYNSKMTFQTYHHHFVFMLEKVLTKTEKSVFNYLSTVEEVDDFLINQFNIKEDPAICNDSEIDCLYPQELVSSLAKKKCDVCNLKICNCLFYDSSLCNGKYFESACKVSHCDLDFMESNMFEEG